MRNIVLIGFMGTGKTSTGRVLARRLGRPFIDIDRKIELEMGMTINDIFVKYGEQTFRQLEKDIINRVARYTNTVIATGGGAVLVQENIAKLRNNGIIVSLTADLHTIIERTGRRRAARPLLSTLDFEENICRLLEQRKDLYQVADYYIDTSYYTPLEVAERIIVFLRHGGYLRGRR